MPDAEVEIIVEIPAGSRNKYEYDHARHVFRLDRRLFSATAYPADYGFIPETLAEDGDPLDALVLVVDPTFPGCRVIGRPVAVFSMTDECVGSTLRAVVRNKMTPICCVGETAEERERGKTEAVIERQLTAAMDGLSSEEIATVVVAYEPIWAIGSGDPASTVDAEDAASFIRSVLVQLSDVSAGERVRILYGGSVNAENAGEFAAEEEIDGVLVGGASLDAKTFADIIRAVGACYRS